LIVKTMTKVIRTVDCLLRPYSWWGRTLTSTSTCVKQLHKNKTGNSHTKVMKHVAHIYMHSECAHCHYSCPTSTTSTDLQKRARVTAVAARKQSTRPRQQAVRSQDGRPSSSWPRSLHACIYSTYRTLVIQSSRVILGSSMLVFQIQIS
jgi:hypothetical protein